MSDDLMVVGGLDQEPIIQVTQEVREDVESIIQDALTHLDIDPILDGIQKYRGIGRIAGMAMARLLYAGQLHWREFGLNGAFIDLIKDRVGLSHSTVERYITVMRMLDHPNISEEIKEELEGRPIRYLIPIAEMIDQGFTPVPREWKQILNAPDLTTLGATIREIKGTEMRKGGIMLYVNREGTIIVRDAEDKLWVIGQFILDDNYLNRDHPAFHGINRIIKLANILEME